MRFNTILDKMTWEPSNIKNDVEKVDRVLTSLRHSLSDNKNLSNIINEYHSFWKCVAEHNLFICVLVLKRIEKVYGKNDECASEGLLVIKEEIKKYSVDDEYETAWKLLSEIELNLNFHIIEYSRYFLSIGKLRKVLKHLENAMDFDNCVAFYLHSICISDVEFRRDVFNNVMSLKWILDISQVENKTLVSEPIKRNIQWNDIPSLLNLIDLYKGIKISDYFKNTIIEWKEYLINQYQPISMMLYQKILKNEIITTEKRINELYDFALLSVNKYNISINAYLFFAFAVTDLPKQYDAHLHRFNSVLMNIVERDNDTHITKSEIEMFEETVSESANRGLNHLIVDKPFIALIRNNPDKVKDYIDTIGDVNLYHISKSLKYKKSQTWNDNNYLPEYKDFITHFANEHTQDEVIELYMNSPLKGLIDFSYVVRYLYQPQEGWISLANILDNYVFRGKLIWTASDDKNIAYRVTLSNACSSYCFPIHHSWIKYHIKELETNFSGGEPVYFKIMSINSKGMIFAYDLSPKPQEIKLKQANNFQTLVFKNIEQLIDGSLPFQGNNFPEEIRLFVTAMICDDNDNILVNSVRKNNNIIESLPYLPVSNCESTDFTLKRLLKYFIGVHSEHSFSPCGVRHICIDRKKRALFFLYRINKEELDENLAHLTLKKSTRWRNFSEYKENAEDEISKSFLLAFDISWSEDTILLHNTNFIE